MSAPVGPVPAGLVGSPDGDPAAGREVSPAAARLCSCSLIAASPGRELGIDDVVVLAALTARTALRRRGSGPGSRTSGVAAAAHAEALVDLLKLGGQGPQPIQRRLVLDGLPRVADQHLGAALLMHRHGVAELG